MIKAAVVIAILSGLFWTIVAYYFGLRDAWLPTVGIGTFVLTLLAVMSAMSSHSGRD